MLWYSLEVPHQDTSNEYPQHMFLWRNKKNIFLIPCFIQSYDKISAELFKGEWIHLKDFAAILQRETTFAGQQNPPLYWKLYRSEGDF